MVRYLTYGLGFEMASGMWIVRVHTPYDYYYDYYLDLQLVFGFFTSSFSGHGQ